MLDKETLEAYVKKDTVGGSVIVERTEGTDYGYIDGKEISSDVVTKEAVERASGFSLFFQGIGNFFGNLWGGITDFVGGLF